MSKIETIITPTNSIVFSTYFDKYLETLDSSQQEYICNARDILNIDDDDHYLHGIPPKNLAINFISNFSILFPILYEPQTNKNTILNELKDNVPEFFYMCDENGNFLKNKVGKMMIDDIKPLKHFRDALEHGTYKLVFNKNEKDYFIKYEVVNKGQRYYKKISLKTLFKVFSYLVDNFLDYSNRLALGCINNMKLISVLMNKFDEEVYLKDEYRYSIENELLDSNLLITESNRNFIIDDMKAASICALFYISFQKNLENLIGPNFISVKSRKITDVDMAKAIFIGEHMDMNSFSFFDNLGGVSTKYEEKLPIENILALTIKSYNNLSNKYSSGDMSRDVLMKRTKTVFDNFQRFLNHIRKLEVLHHLRNSFAHGRTKIGNGRIAFCDNNPKSNKKTYQNVMSIKKMRNIVDEINITIVQKHLLQMEYRIVKDSSYKKYA